MMIDPDPLSDPRTAPDDGEDASVLDDAANEGRSSDEPAEGGDDAPAPDAGSPAG